jgi:thiosulfate/3-mercaptopyruvate sulfurtransferase
MKARDDVLVEPQWLEDHLHDPRVRVIEVDVSPVSYTDGHIPGAMLWNIYCDLKDANYRLRPPAELAPLFAGITSDTTVVLYGYGPALGFWLTALYGHHDVRILNASKKTWVAEGRPTTTQITQPEGSAVTLGAESPNLRSPHAAVRAAVGDPSVQLLDVRTAAEFAGERFWPSGAAEETGRAGHIPSAVHLPLDGVLDDRGAFRSNDELAGVFRNAAATGTVITYCTIGGRACTAWFVLTYLLGHDNVRVYDGSWAEWGRDSSNPVIAA